MTAPLRLTDRPTPEMVTALQTAALLLPLLACLATRGPAVVGMLAAALVAALGWEAAFTLGRGRRLSVHGVTTALVFAVLAPESAPLWQTVLAVSFGAVMGELVFGGRGFGFLPAGLVALAFLMFSFPGLAPPEPAPAVALAALPGGAMLFAAGLLPWRPIVAFLIGVGLAVLLLGRDLDPASLAVILAVPLVFLVADPMGTAATHAGRWATGLAAGMLSVLFSAGAPDTGAVLFAALVAAIFAPLFDEIALRLPVRGHG